MENIQEMQERTDIQRICHFVMYGVDINDFNKPVDTEYLEKVRKIVTDKLRNKFPDDNEYEEIMGNLYDYEDALEKVSVEAGIKSGFKMALQLTDDKKSISDIKDLTREMNI